MPRNLASRPPAVTTPRPVAPHPSSLGVRVLPVVVALAVLASLLPATARAGDLSPSSRVSTAGLGPVKVGMTKGQAERAGGTRLIWSGRAIRGCRYLRPLDRSIRASFMVVNRWIVRVDVARRGIRTVSGSGSATTNRRSASTSATGCAFPAMSTSRAAGTWRSSRANAASATGA